MPIEMHVFAPVHGESVAMACAALELCADIYSRLAKDETTAQGFRDALIDIVTASKQPGLLKNLEKAREKWPKVKTQ